MKYRVVVVNKEGERVEAEYSFRFTMVWIVWYCVRSMLRSLRPGDHLIVTMTTWPATIEVERY